MKSAASTCWFDLLVFLFFFIAQYFGGGENIVFVFFPEQGNAYITCMPGPVRRWNYPVSLCLGNVLFYTV